MLPILHQVVSVQVIEILLNIISQANKASGLTGSSHVTGHFSPIVLQACTMGRVFLRAYEIMYMILEVILTKR